MTRPYVCKIYDITFVGKVCSYLENIAKIPENGEKYIY